MNLKTLSDQDLEKNLQQLIIRERKVLHWILEFIKEIQRRKLYLQKGRSSLFQYLTQDLGYSAGSAQRRIEAIRLMTQAPELAEKIQSGAVTLSQVGILAQAIKQKEAETGEKVSANTKRELISQVENQNTSITQQIVSQGLDLELKPLEKKHVQKDHSVSLTVTLNQEQYEKLLRCQELLGHKLSQEHKTPTVVYSLEALCDYYLSKKDLSAKPVAAKSQSVESVKSEPMKARPAKAGQAKSPELQSSFLMQGKTILEIEVSRSQFQNGTQECISYSQNQSIKTLSSRKTKKASCGQKTLFPSMRRKVFGKFLSCQYQDPRTKHLCGSRYKLEVEHIQPRWAKGEHSLENLTLLCASHNKFKYRRQVGLHQ